MVQLETISKFINRLPGDRYLGPYRFLPIFFGIGAAIEFLMIKWTFNNINFCKYCICLLHGAKHIWRLSGVSVASSMAVRVAEVTPRYVSPIGFLSLAKVVERWYIRKYLFCRYIWKEKKGQGNCGTTMAEEAKFNESSNRTDTIASWNTSMKIGKNVMARNVLRYKRCTYRLYKTML